MTKQSSDDATEFEILFKDDWGEILHRLDFTVLGLEPPMTKGLRDVFDIEYGHNAMSSQMTRFQALKTYGRFLRMSKLENARELPHNILPSYKTWLVEQNLKATTKNSNLHTAATLIGSLQRNYPSLVSKKMTTEIEGFFVEPSTTSKKSLNEQETKRVIAVCQEEIEKIMARLEGRLIIEGNGNWRYQGSDPLIARLLDLGGGLLPTKAQMIEVDWKLVDQVEQRGGIRHIAASLWLTHTDLVPFYVLLLFQTAGNPYSILRISRDCIRPHPLRNDLEYVEWNKERSKSRQYIECPVGRSWSAANVIRRLLTLTDSFVKCTRPRHRGNLFLAMTPFRIATRPADPSLYAMLIAFRVKHDLPDFTSETCRSTNAELHRQAAADELTAAQRRLNHKSSETTQIYVNREAVKAEGDAVIGRIQDSLVRESTIRRNSRGKPDVIARQDGYETVFGFKCGGPFDGIAPGSRVGEGCENFYHCSGCPGAAVPLDDVMIVARLIGTQSSLADAKKRATREGWRVRFDALYEPTLRVLEDDLLPRVPEEVLEQAMSLGQHIPKLFID